MSDEADELAGHAALLDRMEDALESWLRWARVDPAAPRAAGSSPVLRQHMATALIDHRVARTVLEDASAAPRAERGHPLRVLRRRLRIGLQRTADAIAGSRGESVVSWMRLELERLRSLDDPE